MNLFTKMWSPISMVGTIELDGILNASTTKVRKSSAMRIATPIDSVYSRKVDFRANDRCSLDQVVDRRELAPQGMLGFGSSLLVARSRASRCSLISTRSARGRDSP